MTRIEAEQLVRVVYPEASIQRYGKASGEMILICSQQDYAQNTTVAWVFRKENSHVPRVVYIDNLWIRAASAINQSMIKKLES